MASFSALGNFTPKMRSGAFLYSVPSVNLVHWYFNAPLSNKYKSSKSLPLIMALSNPPLNTFKSGFVQHISAKLKNFFKSAVVVRLL
ncbi:hypothetical protein [Helicobacter pylori]|uniref:hypothetical protein n=1 Tax=Helicobacter pylori TaxID=210 RepID=UPI0027E57D17|nr:hypothetical protein [Helicobacter pylori]